MMQSLRLRLTLWYTALFAILSLILVLAINLLAVQYYQRSELTVDTLADTFDDRMGSERIREEIRREQVLEMIQDVRSQDLEHIRVSSFLIFAALLLLSLVGGYYISSEVLSPIKDINRQIKKIQAEDLKAIEYPHNDVDIQELVFSLNDMLTRIANSFRSQREFIEHASHELKTPLSVLALRIERVCHDPALSDKSYHTLQEARDSVTKLNTLLEKLLVLSLAQEQLVYEEFPVYCILDRVVQDVFWLAEEKHIHLEKQDQGSMLTGSAELLEQAVKNVVENALRYAPEYSTVRITSTQYKHGTVIVVEDQGPGVPDTEKFRVFDRFYRVDDSRSRHTGGQGLGLAIAKKIIDLHQGEICVKDASGGGAVFELYLPYKETPLT